MHYSSQLSERAEEEVDKKTKTLFTKDKRKFQKFRQRSKNFHSWMFTHEEGGVYDCVCERRKFSYHSQKDAFSLNKFWLI